MKPNFRLNPQQDVSAAITRIHKQIKTIERVCIPQTHYVAKTEPVKTVKTTLKLVKNSL